MKAMDEPLTVDANGSPVSLDEEDWLICFVPGLLKRWWHPFVHDVHQHVFAIRPAGRGRWTVFDPWWSRLLTATLDSDQARQFLRWAARGDVLRVRESIPGRSSQLCGWMTCAAQVSYLLGRPYRVWTPHRLFERLRREPNVSRVDMRALLTRQHGIETWGLGGRESDGADDSAVLLSA